MKKNLKIYLICIIVLFQANIIFAADSLLVGVTNLEKIIDVSKINYENFKDYFINNSPTLPSVTISSDVSAQIGVIWIHQGDDMGLIRVVIDSNNDGNFSQIDWDDPIHPWNPPDNDDSIYWNYTYPDSYPDVKLKNTTITMHWDDECECVQGFPFESFIWDWYLGSYDINNELWIEPYKLASITWDGRDSKGDFIPNGQYKVLIWLDTDENYKFSPDEINQQIIVKIETASITGTIVDESGNSMSHIFVEASSSVAWGKTMTDKEGKFIISGLMQGGPYQIKASSEGSMGAFIDNVNIEPNNLVKDVGIIKLSSMAVISGIIKLDLNANGILDESDDEFKSFTDKWGWIEEELDVEIEAFNIDGPGFSHALLKFKVGESSVEFMLQIPEKNNAVYSVSAEVDGFASKENKVNIINGNGVCEPIILTKASKLFGKVKLPGLITEYKEIAVMAVNTENQAEKYSGWGQIIPYEKIKYCSNINYSDQTSCEISGEEWITKYDQNTIKPSDSGKFDFNGVPPGIYNLEIRIDGYKVKHINGIKIEKGKYTDLGEIFIDQGSKIYGKIVVRGNTINDQMLDEEDAKLRIPIWIEAWCPAMDISSGTTVFINKGLNQIGSYIIGGLEKGVYEISTQFKEGYELTDENGESPVIVNVEDSVVKNIVLKPSSGIIKGTITGKDINIDLSKVIVELKMSDNFEFTKFASVANKGIDPTTGDFTIDGLPTGDYIFKAGMYINSLNYDGKMNLFSDPNVGIQCKRVFVKNSNTPTIMDISLEKGYSISGKIYLSSTDPPWHDFGDGRGGSANGIKDISNDKFDERISIANDIAGSFVAALPLDLMLMEESNETKDSIIGYIKDNGDGTASYKIDGLNLGAYLIIPPFGSERIKKIIDDESLETEGSEDEPVFFDGGEEVHHWTTSAELIVVPPNVSLNKDFTFANGYKVSGRITLPEIQMLNKNFLQDKWAWIGHLEIESAMQQFLGHGRPLFKNDFNNSTFYDYSFDHVANGKYIIHFFTDQYISESAQINVDNADVISNISVSKGVNIVGNLIDAETSNPVTSKEGIKVLCMSDPFVEGSYRETINEPWSSSYIEDNSGIKEEMFAPENFGQKDKRNISPGKFHLSSVIPGYYYIIAIESSGDPNLQKNKNYINHQVVANIKIPENASGDVNIGTIYVKKGAVIKGRLVDENNEPIPGVNVVAFPSDSNEGENELRSESDDQGYYTILGVNPKISYYDIIAAKSAWMFDDWKKERQWGEKRRHSVKISNIDSQTGLTVGASFVLKPATASLSGLITLPDSSQFMLPFVSDFGEGLPASYILLQQKGVLYKDMLDGIEGITAPQPQNTRIAPYKIDSIEPGLYRVIFMNYGLPRAVIDNVSFKANEDKIINVSWDNNFYKIYGKCTLSSGKYPTFGDIDGVVCINTVDHTIIFGRLRREADGTYTSYEVAGLAGSDTYQLVFFKDSIYDEAPDIINAGEPFNLAYSDKNYDAVIDKKKDPILILRTVQDDNNKILFDIFSSSYFSNEQIEIVSSEPTENTKRGSIYLKYGSGNLKDVEISENQLKMSGVYKKSSNDKIIKMVVALHYGTELSTKLQEFIFDSEQKIINTKIINRYISGQINLGYGDSSGIYIPSDSMDIKNDKYLNVKVILQKSGNKSLDSFPDKIIPVSEKYEFLAESIDTGESLSCKIPVIVQLKYDSKDVSNSDFLNIYRKENNTWHKESASLTIDTENNTIAAEVDTLGVFVVGYGQEEEVKKNVIGGGGSSDCFISTVMK
ncbi:MAG: carboxypeptidase regulatory-like domain-containing protein [Desulfobacterales bacterium]|nr:carboxypeptidase regulatory-like domain-containing protein [Desulfobacterales bacterium]